MAREKFYYRDILEDILEHFNGRKTLKIKEVAAYLNLDIRTVKKLDLPFVQTGKRGDWLLSTIALAKWQAGAHTYK